MDQGTLVVSPMGLSVAVQGNRTPQGKLKGPISLEIWPFMIPEKDEEFAEFQIVVYTLRLTLGRA